MNAPATRCYCPACQTRAALQLLESGRPAMAQVILKDMVACLDEAEREAADQYAAAEAAAQAAAEAAVVAAEPQEPPERRTRPERPPRPGKPAFMRVAAEISAAVARLGEARVAEILGIGGKDLVVLLEGRVSLPSGALAKLRKAE